MKYKYKKQIATGALAFSLLISGTNIFASTPQDIGIKNVQKIGARQNKNSKNFKIKNAGKNNAVGNISAISGVGFIVDVKNMKTKTASSIDVVTDTGTAYSKNGISATATDLALGQKIIVFGALDKTTNILTAKKVKIVTKTVVIRKSKETTTG